MNLLSGCSLPRSRATFWRSSFQIANSSSASSSNPSAERCRPPSRYQATTSSTNSRYCRRSTSLSRSASTRTDPLAAFGSAAATSRNPRNSEPPWASPSASACSTRTSTPVRSKNALHMTRSWSISRGPIDKRNAAHAKRKGADSRSCFDLRR